MIAASLAAFINAQPELASAVGGIGLGIKAFSKTENTVVGELPAPCALVVPLDESPQELWVIGDAKRHENPILQVTFYMASPEARRQAEARFRRLIESATATDTGSVTHPGINFLAYADLLIDTGDHLTYRSNQPNWFSSPTPVIYKNEDSNGEPVVVASGYSVNATAGTVTFSGANLAADKIRATYKVGLIDFDIAGVAHFEGAGDSDLANNPQRFAVTFTLATHFYIKSTSSRYL